MKISVVIPCYRSEKTLKGVLDELKRTLDARPEYAYEFVLVNDCSPDGVQKVIEEYAKTHSFTKAIRFTKNFGQHSALMAGYRQCTGDIIISIDDDGQTPVEALFSLIDKLNEGYDVVMAAYEKSEQNLFRRLGTAVNKLMARSLIGMPKDLEATSFFVMRKLIKEEIIKYENAYPYVLGLILRTTNNIANVQTKHRARAEGRSGYTLRKLLSLWMNGFTAFSVKPLRIATVSGLFFAILGLISAVVVVVNKLTNPHVQVGWSSLMAILLFMGGVIMLMLGLIGEYVGRQYLSINKAPQYVIKDSINTEKTGGNDENRQE